jgi:TonB family protein
MYFDLEEGHPDIYGIGTAMSWREGVLLSLVMHLVMALVFVLMPPIERAQPLATEAQQAELARQRRESQRFVFVQPRLEMPAKKPPTPQADASDRDRSAQSLQRPPNPVNSMPYSRGNTAERMDVPSAPKPATQAPPSQSQQDTANDQRNGSPPPGPGESTEGNALAALRRTLESAPRPQAAGGGTGTGGGLSDALRNVQRYVPQQVFDNPQGGANMFGPAIQFDTKGVEFGPWVRRFIAQIKRNWDVPYAAMAMRGHVVVTFNVHKDGRITDLTVVGPCPVDGFNNSSFNALAASNPTYPLPPEYPSDRAFFTVTFYYNEAPPG